MMRMSIASASATWRRGSGATAVEALRVARCCCAYQRPTFQSTNIANNATKANQARLPWPKGNTTSAASNGPEAVPALPPT